jgi:subtilisin inhibitor-like
MRLLVLTVFTLAAVAAGCGSDEVVAAEGPSARLSISAWPRGAQAGPARRWTLTCNPVSGTHPNAERACARLGSVSTPFRRVPRDAVCTEIYGGPQEAFVTGTFRGRPISAHFNRVNGCEIARWDRIRVLFPIPVGAKP